MILISLPAVAKFAHKFFQCVFPPFSLYLSVLSLHEHWGHATQSRGCLCEWVEGAGCDCGINMGTIFTYLYFKITDIISIPYTTSNNL